MKSAQDLWNEWLEKPCDWDMLGNPIPHKATLGDYDRSYVYAGFMAAHQMLTTSLPAAEDAQGWMPIETAPKEGLICIWIAPKSATGEKWSDGEGEMWAYCYYDRICGQWRTTRPSGHLRCVPERFVTHWMPLPAAPAMSKDSKGGYEPQLHCNNRRPSGPVHLPGQVLQRCPGN